MYPKINGCPSLCIRRPLKNAVTTSRMRSVAMPIE
jgi:hypothetical protein